jgi:Zn-finger nucleic acid-binding protein
MFAHKYDAIEEVNIDECYNCRGFFVDSGELKEIREHLASRFEEDKYLAKLVAENPGVREGDRDLEQRRKEVHELRRSALARWAHLLKFGLTAGRRI